MTPNNTQLSSFFRVVKRGRVICRNLVSTNGTTWKTMSSVAIYKHYSGDHKCSPQTPRTLNRWKTLVLFLKMLFKLMANRNKKLPFKCIQRMAMRPHPHPTHPFTIIIGCKIFNSPFIYRQSLVKVRFGKFSVHFISWCVQ